MDKHLMPEDSPIARNQGQVSSYRFDGENEAGVISTSKIRNASIGSAQIQDASIGSAQISSFSFNQGTGGTITLGGTANGNGVMQVLNAAGGTVVTANNNGITITGGSITIKNNDGVTILDKDGLISSANFFSDSYIDFTDFSTSSTTFVDLGTESLQFQLDRDTQVLVFYYIEGLNDSTDFMDVQVYDDVLADELLIGSLTGILDTVVDWDSGTGLVDAVSYFIYNQPISNIGIFPLPAGFHTIKLQFRSNAAGTSYGFVSSLGYVILGT